MRTIRNLTWFLLAFGLTVWSGLAFAQQPDIYWSTGPRASDAVVDASPEASCIGYLTARGYTFGELRQSGNSYYDCMRKTAGSNQVVTGTTKKECSTLKPVWDQNAKICKAPDEPPKCEPGVVKDVTYKRGKSGVADDAGYSPFFPNTPHDGNCLMDCTTDSRTQVKECFERAGDLFCTYTCVTTGARKSPDSNDPPPGNPKGPDDPRKDVPPFDSPQGKCPKGTVQVGVNSDGVPRCQGTGSEPKNPPPAPPKTEQQDTQQNPDGSTTTTTTTTTSNADGSTTTVVSKTTTGTDGKKTTTETRDTTKSPTGNSGKDDSKKDEEKYDLCKQNPNLTICKNSSVSGTCGQVSCDGDAIQCATLRAAAAMQCKQQEDDDLLKASPLTAKGNAAINGTDLEGLPNSKNAEVVNIPSLNAQGWLGNGAAFRDVSITVQGKQILVPLSKWSEYLLPFRYIMMIIASLISYKILAGAITRS